MRGKHDLKLERLGELAPFRACTKHDLLSLARIGTEAVLPAGHVLCKENEVGRQCFAVVGGEATVTIGGEYVGTITVGSFVGELALLDGGRRLATVTAATDMVVLVFNRSEFEELVNEVPSVTRRILEGLAARLREATQQLHPVGLGV